ncbi:MAG: hypothetical protein R2699_12015 [Acidimicrobiales bacterium]
MASLPVLHPELDSPTVTAGNSAGLNDAAAALVLTSADYAAANGVAPLARIRSWASVGVDPVETGLAPTLAIPGRSTGPACRSTTSSCSRSTRRSARSPSPRHGGSASTTDIVNVNGSGCGLGHPIAATGARMVVSMVHELRRRGQTLGCVSMCAGGGMGSALVLELL